MNFELMVRLGAHFVQHLYHLFKVGTLQGKSWLCCHECDQQAIATFMLACAELVLAICILSVIYEVNSDVKSDCVIWRPRPSVRLWPSISDWRVIGFLWNSMLFFKSVVDRAWVSWKSVQRQSYCTWGVSEFLPLLSTFLSQFCEHMVQEICT
jgi:hypothetical protein